ncbi:MAG: SBBP repeat-containing protein [bacterium]
MKKLFILSIGFILSTQIFGQEWAARYNGQGDSTDGATAIALDTDGNVYVTGRSYGLGTNYDYATIKYNSSGDTMWVRRYNGPANSDDKASAIALDKNGNIYVTGYSYGSGTDEDYVTIKYNSSGDTMWTRRYNGTGNGDDEAIAIALDGNGNIYVTGNSIDSGTGYDYATIKYNSLGDTMWIRRYNGPGNSCDYATAIAVDGNGNAYVTGYGWCSVAYKYATIKYDSSGDTMWARIYGLGDDNEAIAIAVDSNGNVYVTGRSCEDCATIKYNSLGDTMWTRRYNGPGNGSDWARAIVLERNGVVYVAGVSNYDYVTIKYDSSGDTMWARRYNENANDYANAISLDTDGNVYVTGQSYGSGTAYDYATIKYNSSGDAMWAQRYNGPGNGGDCANAIALDGNGYVYVTGLSIGSGTGYDYATIKYSCEGIEEYSNIKTPSTTLSVSQNPVIKNTIVSYSIPIETKVLLSIYDLSGSCVKTLVNGEKETGNYSIRLNAKELKTGVYFVRLTAGTSKTTRKITVIR